MSWIPPKSPHGLIQEDLWTDEWKLLISCLLLNLTTRKQVDSVISEFFSRWPAPVSLIGADEQELQGLIKPLGMWKKRSKTLKRFTEEYIQGNWRTPRDLYGCGKYADDAWRIFCRGDWEEVEPSDHALNNYHNWLRNNEQSATT